METSTIVRPLHMPSPRTSRRRFLVALAGGLLSWPAAAYAAGPTPRGGSRQITMSASGRPTHPHGGRFAVKLQQASL